MKKIIRMGLNLTGLLLLLAVIMAGCDSNSNAKKPAGKGKESGAMISSLKIAQFPVTLGKPWTTIEGADEGSVTIKGPWANATAANPKISIVHRANAAVDYAVGAQPADADFSSTLPVSLANGSLLWLRVTSMDNEISFYKVKVTVENSNDGYGVPDAAWAADAYNAKYRIFPNAPAYGILSYEDIGTKAPVTHWNTQGHNHKYPDVFHFANGNKVETIADWENRRTEIFNILQYYMHGRMPSIAADVLSIKWRESRDKQNTTTISLTHVASRRTATIEVAHNPPTGADAGANKILMFGVGGAPNAARHPGWGTAAFLTSWGGAESNRGGTCATLYGLDLNSPDTPSVNMEYAWAMSVILTVIEQGGLGGHYDPAKVGIYGFSRYGKAAMCIGAFAESRGGNRMGQTYIGSAGSGGPCLDRFIAQVGYKAFAEDPLPVDGTGAKTWSDLTSIIWYQQALSDTPAAGAVNRGVIRGWTAATPGIPSGSLIYDEAPDFTVMPYVHASKGPNADPVYGIRDNWGGIQVLAQARNEVAGWFSARFRQLSDLHDGLDLDYDFDQTGRGKEGVVCTMPFDAHFITALIAPRIVYYEDGYATTRNNTEAQWANWLLCDEIYQMYAEQQSNASIIWRNAIKLYHIPHAHQAYQDVDEHDLTTAIYSGSQPHSKFRTPPFPVDDPRYRWDFNRMDIGRPGHPTIAERVRLMRESTVKVKAVDTRGLLDNPEPLE
ncbi:MAG: hypothetical protein LBH20_10265 [Treponema sp.]|jgi:hypothetical protein|nr:hypothetical protein [Treponema sp.]